MDKYPIPTVCEYCGAPVIYTSNAAIYGREYGNGHCYKCTKCDAYVGVHDGTDIPLGRMANSEVRALRRRAHALFDGLWESNKMKRLSAYQWLAKQLNIPVENCHFGWFGKKELERAVAVLKGQIRL